MDVIEIRDLAVDCIVGTRPEERQKPQRLLLTIALECDLAPAGQSDRLEDTANYSDLRRRLLAMLAPSRHALIETVAAETARECLREPRVAAVTVTVDKPAALPEARSVAVRIRRARGG